GQQGADRVGCPLRRRQEGTRMPDRLAPAAFPIPSITAALPEGLRGLLLVLRQAQGSARPPAHRRARRVDLPRVCRPVPTDPPRRNAPPPRLPLNLGLPP